ncbi:hypothetical protein DFH94DRAFT_678454 [Russula ochroleuca]|uniref:Uncharacterized protein n=1 Tax=Russula ochroleuca TaxID=152965 RepID=A0A9P5TE59_9AGAM|nr:hypothetical protein DFH94DRAFT_678454 [Russula ochroleuca]
MYDVDGWWHEVHDRGNNREKRLLKLVGAVVVKMTSTHSRNMRKSWDDLQLTHIIAEKSSSYKVNTLCDEKKSKIKRFAREYILKVLHRLKKVKRRPPDSDSGVSAQSLGYHHFNTDTTTSPLPPMSTPSLQEE